MYHEIASNCSCQQSRYTVTCSIGVGSSPATHAGPASLAVSSSVCSHTDLLDCWTAPETNTGCFGGSLFSGSLVATSSRLATVGFVITGAATEDAFGKNLLPGRRSLSGLTEKIDLRGGLGEGSFSRGMLCAGGCAKEWVVDVGSSLGGAVLIGGDWIC